MLSCDLCGKAADCLQKEIDGQEFDVCQECWAPLSEKLSRRVNRILEELEACQDQEEYQETLI